MNAAIFVRVSTARQDYQRQISDLKRGADQQGLKVVEVIKEKISGTRRRNI